jgi:hypothetical protein
MSYRPCHLDLAGRANLLRLVEPPEEINGDWL